MALYFETKDLSVGYQGKPLIHHIALQMEKGKILTLIGPNGAGKSTLLKTITRQLAKVRGTVHIAGRELSAWSPRELAREMAVVLTDRVSPELVTCAQVVAMGRYPYTDLLGKLTGPDKEAVRHALARVRALDLAEQDFSTLSDGQRQRILLARAICQEPEILVLDEPTAYLDIRHKVELLDILREMAQEKGTTIILSLHEIDLATKISDYLVCVKGETPAAFGPPEEILKSGTIEGLYGMEQGSYNLLFGSTELPKPQGSPQIFVIGGGGLGIPVYRALQKQGIPFGAGILFENDVDAQVAVALSDHVVTAPAFEPMTRDHYHRAARILEGCRGVLNAGAPIGSLNRFNQDLLDLAKKLGIPQLEKGGAPWKL